MFLKEHTHHRDGQLAQPAGVPRIRLVLWATAIAWPSVFLSAR
jgi:hypothetical protein